MFSNNPSPGRGTRAREALREIYVDDMGRADLFFQFFETLPGQELNGDARDSITFRAAVSQYENGNYERAVSALTDYTRSTPRAPTCCPPSSTAETATWPCAATTTPCPTTRPSSTPGPAASTCPP